MSILILINLYHYDTKIRQKVASGSSFLQNFRQENKIPNKIVLVIYYEHVAESNNYVTFHIVIIMKKKLRFKLPFAIII